MDTNTKTRLTIEIEKNLKAKVKAKIYATGKTLRQVISALLEKFLAS